VHAKPLMKRRSTPFESVVTATVVEVKDRAGELALNEQQVVQVVCRPQGRVVLHSAAATGNPPSLDRRVRALAESENLGELLFG
jgi:hypothetical protein